MIGLRLHLTDFFGQGLRLVNEKTKSKFGKSNGGKITGLMIKYPLYKKNAQLCNYTAYRSDKYSHYENNNTFSIITGTCSGLHQHSRSRTQP